MFHRVAARSFLLPHPTFIPRRWITALFTVALTFAAIASTTAKSHHSVQATLVVTSAASYAGESVAPEMIATAFGAELATTTTAATDADPNAPGIQLPTTLGGSSVKVNGVAAPLLFVSPQQINFVVPATLTPSPNAQEPATVEVTAGNGVVTVGKVRVTNLAPGVFTADSSGGGIPAAYLVRVKPDQRQESEPLVLRDAVTGALTARAIDLGAADERVFLILYATGVRRAPDTNGDGNLNETIRLLFNGYEVVPAFAGPHPELAGLDQINCEIPRDLLGNQKLTVRVTVGGASVIGNTALTTAGPTSNQTEVLLAVPPIGQVQWRAEGLEGINVNALTAVGDLLLLGTTTGIYRSVDDGVNFLPVNYALPVAGIGRSTLALSVYKDRYRAGTERGVWNAFDDGSTWISLEIDQPLTGERVLALAADGDNTFAATDGKGVYRSTWGSAPRWRPMGLSGQKVTALAFSNGRLLAATADNGLQATINGGETWQAVGRALPAGAIINTLVASGGRLYAGTNAGLWRSTDNGDNWTELKLGTAQSFNVQTILRDNSNLFAGTAGEGILVSNDDGVTWKPINTGLTNLNVLSLTHYAGRLFAGTKGGVFATAMAAGSNLPPVANAQTVTLDEDTTAAFTLTGSDPNDDPLTFKLLSQPRFGYLTGTAPNLIYTPYPNANGTDSFNFIAQDGKTSSRLATITFNVRPTDDPMSFTLIAPESSVVGGLVIVEAYAQDPDNEAVTVTATTLPTGATLATPSPNADRVVAKLLPTSPDSYQFTFTANQSNGATLTRTATVAVTASQPSDRWAQAPLFFDQRVANLLPVVEPNGSTTLYLVAQQADNSRFEGLYRATDERTWTRIGTGLSVNAYASQLYESAGALWLDSSEGIFRSGDKGVSFVNVTRGKGLPKDGTQFDLTVTGNQVLAWTSNQLFRSADAGETWAEVTNNLPLGASTSESTRVKNAAISGNALLVSISVGVQDNGARTYRSLDNGATWQFVPVQDAVSLLLVPDGDTVYGLSAIQLHRSDDRGATWQVLTPLGGPPRFGQIIPNVGVVVRAGVVLLQYSDGALYRSPDRGQNWTDVSADRPAEASRLAISPQWLYATTRDGLVYRRPNR